MKHFIRRSCLLLVPILLLSLCGCSVSREDVMELVAPGGSSELSDAPVGELIQTETDTTERRVYNKLTGDFDPLSASADGDLAVVKAVQLKLAGRQGEESPSIITTEKKEDGSFTVRVELRGGIRFSDGVALNSDDLLFTLYALMDPSYEGENTLRTLPIPGVTDYYRGVNETLYEKYSELFDKLYAEGRYDEDIRKHLAEVENNKSVGWAEKNAAQKAVEEYDVEKSADIRELFQLCWREEVEKLVPYTMKNSSSLVEYHTGYTVEELRAEPGLQIMFTMVEWSYGTLTENGTLVGKKTGNTWDLKSSFPTMDDFFREVYESYGGSAESYWQIEGIGRGELREKVRSRAILRWSEQDKDWDGGVKRIAGIERLGDRLVAVTFEEYHEVYLEAIEELCVLPLHIYGDSELYDYAAGRYGFSYGNVNLMESDDVVGAGAYVLESWDGRSAVLSANPNYWTELNGPERFIVTVDKDKAH